MCRRWFKNEFRWRKFRLQHDHPQAFVDSQWLPRKWFCAWRVVLALYLFCSTISIGNGYNRALTLIFMTIWSYIILTLYFIIAAAVSLWYTIKDPTPARPDCTDKDGAMVPQDGADLPGTGGHVSDNSHVNMGQDTVDIGEGSHIAQQQEHIDTEASQRAKTVKLPVIMRTQWVLFYISSAASIAVSLAFWTLLFRGNVGSTAFSRHSNLSTHLFNCLFMIIENFLSSIPMHFVHFVIPLGYCITYMLFSVVYWALGGRGMNDTPYIYSFLNYGEKPIVALITVLCMAFIFIPFCYTIHYLIHILRCKLYQRRTARRNKTTPEDACTPDDAVNVSAV